MFTTRSGGISVEGAVMNAIENMLAQWRSAYGEWVLAELQLREARQRNPHSRAVAILEDKVRRLQRDCSAVQDAVSDAMNSHRAPQDAVRAH